MKLGSVMFDIRPFHPSDLTALYRICLQTADNGGDATHSIADPDLHGHIYAAPYAVLEPDLCFVLTKEDVPIGYILGTRDSAEFSRNCEQNWFPPLRQHYPLPSADDNTNDAHFIRLLHRGHGIDEGLGDYPAHLHIDILPEGQGAGFGRKLMQTFLDKLRELNVSGVHLGVSKNNPHAIGFYERIGFERLQEYPTAIVFGMQL